MPLGSVDNSTHAAFKYINIDHMVSTAATYNSRYPKKTKKALVVLSQYNNTIIANICTVVLIFPRLDTATRARLPSSAIHSRKAETMISRLTIIAAGIVINKAGTDKIADDTPIY